MPDKPDLSKYLTGTLTERPDDYPYPESERPPDTQEWVKGDDGKRYWQAFVPAPNEKELVEQAKEDALETVAGGLVVRVEALKEAGHSKKEIETHVQAAIEEAHS